MKVEYIPIIVNSILAVVIGVKGNDPWKAAYWASATGIAISMLHLKG